MFPPYSSLSWEFEAAYTTIAVPMFQGGGGCVQFEDSSMESVGTIRPRNTRMTSIWWSNKGPSAIPKRMPWDYLLWGFLHLVVRKLISSTPTGSPVDPFYSFHKYRSSCYYFSRFDSPTKRRSEKTLTDKISKEKTPNGTKRCMVKTPTGTKGQR